MDWPVSLQIALKEWAVVCRALESGRQIVLLRKGGISDVGGVFHVQHREFLLFPTWLHQSKPMLKPEAHQGCEPLAAEPAEVTLGTAGVVTDVIQLQSRQQIDAIDDEHVWAPPLIDMRFAYRPENPLYLLLVRAYRMRQPVTLANTPAYAGCKSWVPLDESIRVSEAKAVLDDGAYGIRRTRVLNRLDACLNVKP